MKVKRTGKFKVKASHPDYEMIKVHTIEAKEIYNYANYIIRADLNGALNIMRKAGHELIDNIPSFKKNWIFPIGKYKVNNLSYS